ncbi:MAG: hypothetical protein JSR37_07860 [Verrucomicrobia bacterium]|nr:hypothetical protein [Verrucomicrobiota bacterium]MBS0637828.1 hypothetical protein [Verrucomicrobiota bacterium]
MKAILFLLFLQSYLFADISSYKEFEAYSTEINGERYTKFVVDLTTDDVYYLDVAQYPLHRDFVVEKFGLTFEEYIQNYEENKRFLYCSLVHHLQQDLWTLTLWEGDKASAAHLEQAFHALKTTFYLADSVHFRPTSTAQEVLCTDNIPFITNDELYRTGHYQLLHAAENVGILRIGKMTDWQEDEIIVLSEALADISPVAGIITEQFSTPLSHLALRARTWDIPHAAIKNFSYSELDGKLVYFKTSASGYELRLATDADTIVKTVKPIRIPKADLAEKAIKPLRLLRRADCKSYGTKAANLGECVQYSIDGYAIPFYYYDKHLKEAKVDIVNDDLATIRQKIRSYPIDKSLLQIPISHAFVRSSTNAEDLPNFSGAGLYETVPNTNDLEDAIKAVWASVWSDKAYKERTRCKIAHNEVYAGVLIQPSIAATSAGVLVTKDIFDPTETMEVYTINASHGLGLKVVDGAMIPEQIIYNFDNKGIKVLSRLTPGMILTLDPAGGIQAVPNPHAGKPVLSDLQVTKLGNAAHAIKRIFRTTLDIEWLFVDERLYIMQARPFN